MNLAAIVLPLLGIVLVYARVRSYAFVWDDGLLSHAPVYRACDLAAIFTTPANTFEYLPVRDLTLCLDHALFGDWAGGFHLQNVLIFALACSLLGQLYRRIFAASPDPDTAARAPQLALLCCLVFALHPLQVEPVAFITARNALLALLFVCAALACIERWIATSRPLWYALSLVATVLALFSKATALPTAGLVFLLHAYLERDARWSRSAVICAPHAAVGLCAALLHGVIASTHGAMGAAPSLAELVRRLPRSGFVVQFYLYKFLWPFGQSTDYVLDGVREHAIGLGITALALAGGFAWILARGVRVRSTPALFGAGYLVALVPVLDFFPTHPPVADRYAQLPLVFLVPLILVPVFSRVPRPAAVVIGGLLVALLSVLSFRQVPVWKNDVSLFAHAVAVDPDAVHSIENLAYTQWLRNDEDAALEAFALYADKVPNDGQYELFQAWHAVHARDLARAEDLLGRASRKPVAGYLVHIVRAEIETARGDRRRAVREYRRAREDAQRRFQRDARARIYLQLIDRLLDRWGVE